MAALLLAGCDRARQWTGDDRVSAVADANARTALMRAADLRSELDMLKAEMDDLRSEVRNLRQMDQAISADLSTIENRHVDLARLYNHHTH